MGEKIKKCAIVIFLTLLVWAWAFNDLEETETRPATLVIAKNTDSDIFVTFEPPAPVELTLDFKGTPEKINDLKYLLDKGLENLEFIFNPKDKKKPSPYPLDILEFLNDNSKIRKLELSVIKSNVESVQVTIEKLVKKELKIQCVDEKGADVTAESINPSLVHVFVRDSFTGDAKVVLTERDIAAAKKDYVLQKPFVELAPNDRRVGETVKIILPSIDLPDQTVQPKRVGFSMDKNLMGKYTIELLNEQKIIGALPLKATQEAWETYKNQQVHIFVVALDGDEKKEGDGIITRQVKYNFPLDDVAKGHIRLAKDEPREAEFKLVPLKQTPDE